MFLKKIVIFFQFAYRVRPIAPKVPTHRQKLLFTKHRAARYTMYGSFPISHLFGPLSSDSGLFFCKKTGTTATRRSSLSVYNESAAEAEDLLPRGCHTQIISGNILDQILISAVGDILRQLGIFLLQHRQTLRIVRLFGAGMLQLTVHLPQHNAHHQNHKTEQEQKERMLTAVVLFCASGTGIYGALDAGMTGNHSILIAKAVLDFFTAAIFACQLGKATSLIGIPQFAVLMTLFLLAKLILPLADDMMIRDFKACGGFLLLATGFRMMQLRPFPVADMIPSMVLVMPASYLWSQWVLPMIS